eukprot:5100850-Pyramimonas_sp.AAC.1
MQVAQVPLSVLYSTTKWRACLGNEAFQTYLHKQAPIHTAVLIPPLPTLHLHLLFLNLLEHDPRRLGRWRWAPLSWHVGVGAAVGGVRRRGRRRSCGRRLGRVGALAALHWCRPVPWRWKRRHF